MHFYTVPDGRDCREKGQALRKEDERERGEAVSSWWLVAGPAPSPAARCHLSQVSRKDHYGSVILVDSLGRTDLPLYISEVRGYECGRVGSKLAHLSAKAATHVSDEKLHADRATHPSIVVVARRGPGKRGRKRARWSS